MIQHLTGPYPWRPNSADVALTLNKTMKSWKLIQV